MPFFQYEIRKSDGNDTVVYDAIFWAPDETAAEDHMFASVHFHMAVEIGDIYAEYGVMPSIEERADRVLEFTLLAQEPSQFPETIAAMPVAETTYSWLVSDAEIHETRPERAYYHSPWQIGNLAQPPSTPLQVLPEHLNLTGLRLCRSDPHHGLGLLEGHAAAGNVAKFLLEQGGQWRPFTQAEISAWSAANDLEPFHANWLLARAYLQAEYKVISDTTVFHVTDKFIKDMFAVYGEIVR